jgi:hypothetical protein
MVCYPGRSKGMAKKHDTTTLVERDPKTGRFISGKDAKRGKRTPTVATVKKKK